ncbi:MAG: hypothetical protein CM15mP18_1130 [Methanobacteriota archaeon]|nr:MAG: hypothetical protein CM15mP18_1130 [Euryarchaeota archaeon]
MLVYQLIRDDVGPEEDGSGDGGGDDASSDAPAGPEEESVNLLTGRGRGFRSRWSVIPSRCWSLVGISGGFPGRGLPRVSGLPRGGFPRLHRRQPLFPKPLAPAEFGPRDRAARERRARAFVHEETDFGGDCVSGGLRCP